MKKTVGIDIGSYTFNALSKQITFSGISSLLLSQFLLITNTTRNIIIYNFADQNNGASSFTQFEENYILTLKCDTTSMNNTDSLQIFIEVLDNTEDQLILLRSILKALQSNSIVDPRFRQKMVIDAVGTSTTTITNESYLIDPETQLPVMDIATVLPIIVTNSYTIPISTECEAGLVIGGSAAISSPVGTSLNLVGQGPTVNPPTLAPSTIYQATWEGPVDQRWIIMNDARMSFNQNIRKKLDFTNNIS